MGANLTYLNEANTDVVTECGDWGPISYSVSGMQGWRRSMEDDHVAYWDKDKRVGIFGVFDGHGGRGAARFAAHKLIHAMVNSKAYQNNDYPRALHDAFMEVDREMSTPDGAKEVMDLHNEDDNDEHEQKILLHPSQLPQVLQQILGIQQVGEAEGNDDDDDDETGDDDDYQGDEEQGTNYTTTEDSVASSSSSSLSSSSSKGGDIPMKDGQLSVHTEGVAQDGNVDDGFIGDGLSTTTTTPQTTRGGGEGGVTTTSSMEEVVGEGEGIISNDVEEEIDLDKLEDNNKDTEESSILMIPNNIGDMIKVNEDGLIEIPDSVLWNMLGRKITADAQGCTAVVCALVLGSDDRPAKLICANTGDSRCVLARGTKAYALSEDHKPSQETEMDRILAAGGQVEECMGQYRVQGDLNLSRALGDHRYKENKDIPPECQMISAMPDLRTRQLSNEDTHIILGCDGIWEIHSNQEAVDYVLAHEKAALGLINRTPHSIGVWRRSKGKKRKGSPVKTGEKAPEVRSFKEPRINDVTLHPDAHASQTAFSLAALSGAACQATVCPELRFDDPKFEGNGCDNLTFMIIKIPEEIRKALPPPNPEETISAGLPTVYGQLPTTRKRGFNGKEVEEEKNNTNNNTMEPNAKRVKTTTMVIDGDTEDDTSPPSSSSSTATATVDIMVNNNDVNGI